MSYGMQILQSDGTLWLSPEVTPMNLIDKGVMAGINGEVFQTRIPSGVPAIFFVRMQNELYASFSQIDQTDTTHSGSMLMQVWVVSIFMLLLRW
jgi:hypothetical protein